MPYKDILVTGATGFVGSHLLDYLLEVEPDTIIHGLRRPNADMKNVQHIADCVEWITGDLCDATSMMRVVNDSCPCQVYHLGALSWVSPSWDMPAAYMQTNAIGTINLLNAIEELTYVGTRVLVSCTPEEYGDADFRDGPLTEKTLLSPCNPYAASKVAQDAVCQVYHKSYGTDIVRTRAFNHEGPRRNANGAIASFARQIARIELGRSEDNIVRHGNLTARRNFTHVADMVRAYHLAMNYGESGELYLVGSENVCTMQECLDKLVSMSAMKDAISTKLVDYLVRPTELNYLVGDYTKFRQLTGWTSEHDLDDILHDVLEYWRDRVAKGND